MKHKKTELRIMTAFCQLLLTTPIEEIGAQTIIKAADVSKSTFYNYFSSKEDLVTATLNYAFDQLTIILNDDLLYQKPTITQLLILLRDRKNIYYPLATKFEGFDKIVENYILNMLKYSEIKNLSAQLEKAYRVPAKYALEYYVHTILRTILTWIRSGYEESPQILADILYQTVNI
ncbi:AcrR family transcriptional regulator [Streptococcus rupicaprae]|uniref:AcrR family transcriptional regulator n=1 Tax=Streptococcus rupicaprae TaxID=759619 RepID=A0ABV2FF92_9STRE